VRFKLKSLTKYEIGTLKFKLTIPECGLYFDKQLLDIISSLYHYINATWNHNKLINVYVKKSYDFCY